MLKSSFVFTATIVLFICNTLHAQLPDLKKATQNVTSAANPGQLLTQFTDAIKPTSFLSSWSGAKGNWLGKASKITSAISMAQSVSSLVRFLKPSSFKTGFHVQSLLSTANTVRTMSSAGSLIKSLEGGLKPESLSDSWGQQRSGWLSALSVLR